MDKFIVKIGGKYIGRARRLVRKVSQAQVYDADSTIGMAYAQASLDCVVQCIPVYVRVVEHVQIDPGWVAERRYARRAAQDAARDPIHPDNLDPRRDGKSKVIHIGE